MGGEESGGQYPASARVQWTIADTDPPEVVGQVIFSVKCLTGVDTGQRRLQTTWLSTCIVQLWPPG